MEEISSVPSCIHARMQQKDGFLQTRKEAAPSRQQICPLILSFQGSDLEAHKPSKSAEIWNRAQKVHVHQEASSCEYGMKLHSDGN